MNAKNHILKPSCSLAFVFLLLALVSCRTVSVNYRVPESNQIQLQSEGSHQNTWQTDDLSIEYRYLQNAGILKISGRIVFSDHIKNYAYLENFDLIIHFLDADHKIIADRDISPLSNYNEVKDLTFEKSLKVPPGTTAITFSYSGEARSSGGEKDPRWNFWKTPKG